jgi:hypothetical protein
MKNISGKESNPENQTLIIPTKKNTHSKNLKQPSISNLFSRNDLYFSTKAKKTCSKRNRLF